MGNTQTRAQKHKHSGHKHSGHKHKHNTHKHSGHKHSAHKHSAHKHKHSGHKHSGHHFRGKRRFTRKQYGGGFLDLFRKKEVAPTTTCPTGCEPIGTGIKMPTTEDLKAKLGDVNAQLEGFNAAGKQKLGELQDNVSSMTEKAKNVFAQEQPAVTTGGGKGRRKRKTNKQRKA